MDYDFADDIRGPDREGNRVIAFISSVGFGILLIAAGVTLGMVLV